MTETTAACDSFGRPRDLRSATIRQSVLAGVAVAMVAVPLCVGIAAISPGISVWAGILSGIIGGILVGSISRSRTAISGPTAGLTAVVATQLAILESFEALLLAVMFAGLLQIILGCVKSGGVAAFFPASVIRGLLFAIGIILILKQVPHVLGHDTDPEGEMAFLQPDRENTFSELVELTRDIHRSGGITGIAARSRIAGQTRSRPAKKCPEP